MVGAIACDQPRWLSSSTFAHRQLQLGIVDRGEQWTEVVGYIYWPSFLERRSKARGRPATKHCNGMNRLIFFVSGH
jgi:hypothetical protein